MVPVTSQQECTVVYTLSNYIYTQLVSDVRAVGHASILRLAPHSELQAFFQRQGVECTRAQSVASAGIR